MVKSTYFMHRVNDKIRDNIYILYCFNGLITKTNRNFQAGLLNSVADVSFFSTLLAASCDMSWSSNCIIFQMLIYVLAKTLLFDVTGFTPMGTGTRLPAVKNYSMSRYFYSFTYSFFIRLSDCDISNLTEHIVKAGVFCF